MKNTILRLSGEISIIILSGLVMLFSLMSDYSLINNTVSFLFVISKSLVFIIVPLSIYILEKENIEFKKVAGIYTSYFIINSFITIITSLSIVNDLVPIFWKMLFDLINLIVLLSSLLILIEQTLIYNGVKNKIYSNTIMKIVYIVGDFVSYPFLIFIDKKIKK